MGSAQLKILVGNDFPFPIAYWFRRAIASLIDFTHRARARHLRERRREALAHVKSGDDWLCYQFEIGGRH